MYQLTKTKNKRKELKIFIEPVMIMGIKWSIHGPEL